ncbi:hypothetical protein GH714_022866 [Hevea brasiliensis]|uniref:C3H1-type domain-containing protein n=1 Tax=Hevea brasiliensis TaxID=3981 RepID=A0A6A6KQN0_HEVBR|nr:hypothetical protein GH714_022866 [Hevea brasiliensis]
MVYATTANGHFCRDPQRRRVPASAARFILASQIFDPVILTWLSLLPRIWAQSLSFPVLNSVRLRPHPDAHNSIQSPRLTHRKPFDDDLPRRLTDYIQESRPDLRTPPRVLPDRFPARLYPPANVDPDSYRRLLDNQPLSPMKVRRELEGSSRGKHQNLYPNHEIGEQVREGSPVELDVSFKSNSLVAKAIVMPPSSFAGVSDLHLTPRNEKERKALVLTKDTSSSSVIKPNEGTVKLDNAVSVANNASSPDINQQQSKVEVTASADGFAHGLPASSEPEKNASTASADIVDSQPCSNETNMVPETQKDRVEGFAMVMVSEDDTSTNSGRLCPPNIKRKRSHSTSPLGSSSHGEGKSNSVNYLHGISNTDKDFTKLLSETTSSDIDHVEPASKQPCQNVGSFLLEREIKISSHEAIDEILERPSSDSVSVPLENVPTGGSLHCMISTGGSKENTPNIKKSNEKVEMPQLNLSKSEVNDLYVEPVNMVTSDFWVDATLRLSFKDPTPTEFTLSGNGCRDVGLRAWTDGICDFPQRSSPDVVQANVSINSTVNASSNGTSPQNQKKRKLSGIRLESTCPTVSDVSEKAITASLDNCCVEDVIALRLHLEMGTAQCQFPSELQFPDSDERMHSKDVDNDCSDHVKNDLPSLSSNFSSFRDVNEVSTTNSSGEVMGLVPDTLSGMDCLETLPDVPNRSSSQLSIEKVGGDDEVLLGKPPIHGVPNISAVTCGPLNTEIDFNSDNEVENDCSFSGKTGLFPSQDSRNITQTLSTMSGEVYGKKNQRTHAVSRIYPGRSSVPGNKAFSSTVPTQWQLPKKIKFQNTSYIRKGNSLVMKHTPVAAQSQGFHGLSSSVYRLNSSVTDEMKKNAGSDTRTGVADPSNFMRTGVNAAFERPRTAPLASATKLPNHTTNSLGDCISSSLAEPLHNCAAETAPDPVTYAGSNDMLKSSENAIIISENLMTQTGQINNLDSCSELNDRNAMSSNANGTSHVKQKSNQLIATSNPSSFSVSNARNIPALPSNGYYKRRKNQLVRTSSETHVKPKVNMPNESVNPEGQSLHNITSSSSLSKGRSREVMTCKPSKFSLVWTLRSDQLLNADGDPLHHEKEIAAVKKEGYCLHKVKTWIFTSKVQGIKCWGSSLKWSQSIERQSKKATEVGLADVKRGRVFSQPCQLLKSTDVQKSGVTVNDFYWAYIQEATLAVAEAEKKKENREVHHVLFLGQRTEIFLLVSEWIFRIGSFRYKMDSSRQTLQRISDNESSYSAAFQTEKDSKRPYVPRRLVIGTDEYVRIGNDNQLVRDPKKRTRLLASEKVRWSLHTARSQLARKRKYYCKLTHKVIPERMPDCSYFLQVSEEAQLRLPTYKVTGSCPQGSKCKLHHSKNRSKGRKNKKSREKKNAQGRYFGSMHINLSELGTAVSEKHSAQDNAKICFEGSIPDYIYLDVGDDTGENSNLADEQTSSSDGDAMDLQLVSLDELIKPICIMTT